TSLSVIVIRLRDVTQKVHWAGVAEVVVQRGEDEALSTKDFLFSKAIVGKPGIVLYMKSHGLFILGGNQESSNADELELVETNDLVAKETIDNVDSEEKGLGQHGEPLVNLNEPVNENLTSIPLQIALEVHIIRVWLGSGLELAEIVENLSNILRDHARIIDIVVGRERNATDGTGLVVNFWLASEMLGLWSILLKS